MKTGRSSLVALILALAIPFQMNAGGRTVSGSVFCDSNGNGIRDSREKGLPSVAVSDGFSIHLTDSHGNFSIEPHPKARFIAVYSPSGYRPTGRFYSDIRGLMTSDEGGTALTGVDFGLGKVREYGSFVHMSDIEQQSYNEWIDKVKDFAMFNDVDFIATTGDICYAKGLKLMSEHLNDSTLGRRTVFSIGNHDLIKGNTDYLGNPYGEKMFEDFFGPSWYAFSVKGVHFLVTPILAGDAKPSYTADDLRSWINSYISLIPAGAPVILMSHGCDSRLLPENGNVNAFFYGHRHTHYRTVDTRSGIPFYCTNSPSGAGNDHSPAALRLVEFDRNGVISTRLRYFPLKEQICAHVSRRNGTPVITASVYDAVSDVSEVVVQFPDGKRKSLRQMDDFTWEATLGGAVSGGNLTLAATFASGSRAIARIGTEAALKWVNRLSAKPFLCNPIVDGNHIYIAAVDNENGTQCGVYSISAEDGAREWYFHTENSVFSDIALYEGVIYAGDTDYNIYAIKASDGTLLWSRRTSDVKYPLMTEGLFVEDGVVYFGADSHLCALNAADGSTIWTNKADHDAVTNVCTKRSTVGVLFANCYWRGRFGYDKASGTQLWHLSDYHNRYSTCTPVVADTTFIYTGHRAVIQVGARSGEVLRQQVFSETFDVKSEPLVCGDRLFTGTSDSGIMAVNLQDFTKAWLKKSSPALIYTVPYSQDKERTVESSPVPYGENIIVGASDGAVYCLSRQKGAYVWHLNIGLPVLVKPVVRGDDLIITDFAGNIYCYDLNALPR